MVLPNSDFGSLTMRFTGDEQPNGAECKFAFFDQASAGFANWVVDIPAILSVVPFDTIITNDSELSTILLKQGPDDLGPSAEIPIHTGGTAGADGVVPSVACLVTKNTAFGGRPGRGRTYWPFCLATWPDDGGVLGPGVVTTITNVFETFRTQMDTGGYPLAVEHSAGSPLSLPSDILSFACQSRVATQRRRLRP